MTTMPTIDDRMVVRLRRTGKRRASYRSSRRDRLAGGPRVVLQRSPDCFQVNQPCDCDANGRCAGTCNSKLICRVDPFGPVNGTGPFDF